jgi:resuscitation-promoting factor RpfA
VSQPRTPPLSQRRRVALVVLWVLALFFSAFGVGAANLAVAGLGAAAGIIGTFIITNRRTARVWHAGNGHVHSVTGPPSTGEFGRCVMTLIIDVPDMESRTQSVRDTRVPLAKWPDQGDDLPIEIASDDRRRVRVLWDKVPTHAEVGAGIGLAGEYDEAEDTISIAYTAAGPPVRMFSGYIGATPPPVVQQGRSAYSGATPPAAPRGPTMYGGATPPRTSAAGPSPYAGATAQRTAPPDERIYAGVTPPYGIPVVEPDAAPSGPSAAPSGPSAAPSGPSAAPPGPSASAGPPAGTPSSARDQHALPTAAPEKPRQRPSPRPRRGDGDARAAAPAGPAAAGPAAEAPAAVATISDPTARADESELSNREIFAAYLRAARPDRPGPTASPRGAGITLAVRDLNRAVAFYREVLDFSVINSGPDTAVIELGGTRVLLRRVTEPPVVNQGVVYLNIEVPDVHERYEDLRALGLAFVRRPEVVATKEGGGLWAAALRDPDGYGIALTHLGDPR